MFVKIFVWKIHLKFFLRKGLIGYPHRPCGKAVYNMFITYFPHQNVKSVENHIYFSTDFYTSWNITAHVINIVFHIFNIVYSPTMFKHSIQQSVENELTFRRGRKIIEIWYCKFAVLWYNRKRTFQKRFSFSLMREHIFFQSISASSMMSYTSESPKLRTFLPCLRA